MHQPKGGTREAMGKASGSELVRTSESLPEISWRMAVACVRVVSHNQGIAISSLNLGL